MESAAVEPARRRGRKRKINDVQNPAGGNGQKKLVETRSVKLVGRYVLKEFEDNGVFLGKIVFYHSGLYRVNYEDGDFEDLDSGEIKMFLAKECDLEGEWSERKEKFDKLLIDIDESTKVSEAANAPEPAKSKKVYSSLLSEMSNGEVGDDVVMEGRDDGGDNADGADSSSDSCENTGERDGRADTEVPLALPPELPPSSGHIGIPEEYVDHLLSVHSFLRSFSVPLFLYPFGLDDFVGALNCSVANTLLDSVHVALLRALKRHIERLSEDGLELAVNCLRCLDWSLLDNLTWPVYLVHYLTVMGNKVGPELKGFYAHALDRDYYTLSAGKKLIVLQILCDDVLDSEELREEMDVREESEVGIDVDASTMVEPTGGPRRVHPRYSKTFASKDRENMTSIAENHEIKPRLGRHSTQAGGPVGSSDEDANVDECCICGMEGLLLCCDGCPSSYHSRCIGLNKTHMPEGSWYCPECKINATEPKILQGTDLKGGHNFGVDPYGQVFVATCDHLLVLKASMNYETCIRYYNRSDIPGVLHSLHSKAEHVVTYSEICKGIMQYWEVPNDTLPCYEVSEVGLQLANGKEGGECTNGFDTLLDKSVLGMIEIENTGSCVTGISAAGTAVSSLINSVQEPVLNGNSLNKMTKSDQLGNTDSTVQHSACNGLIGQPAVANKFSQQSASSVTQIVSGKTRSHNVNYSGAVNGASETAKIRIPCLDLSNGVDRKSSGNPRVGCLYMGSSFKTNGYINNYMHGDFAASAAANLAILSSEEKQVPESHASYNHRRVMSDNISLQIKAFSSAAMRFSWPSAEKKHTEIPRERCSWCFSCKATVVSKRGCLLNAAVSNANRGAAKALSGVRLLKNGDGRLPGIAAYIMFMEDSLNGLVVGPFLNDTFRKGWRKQVELGTTCNAVKILLLELEENIRTIALSGDWTKLIDGCSAQSSTSQIAANTGGSTQKRRPGRRGRKPSAVVEVATDDSQDMSNDFTWWRGGALSKLMFQGGILPCSMIRKAARQGGKKKITGLHYAGGHETPKCSRQLMWRSAVEMSRNMAQLALQVRYFDFHVRWSDLVRPEQNSIDVKGPDTEASVFRNASICGKKIVEYEIRYCIDFGSQKHLPARVMKNIAEVEQVCDDAKERYWFSESRIPLYLIKEYESKVEKNKLVNVPSKLQKRQCRVPRKNIFSYLWLKQDDTVKNCCSCHQDVLHRNAVKCSACQGLCHEQCATSSTVHRNEEVEFLITCKHCCETRTIAQVQRSYGSPTSPLLLPGQDLSNAGTTKKRTKSAGHKGPSASVAMPVYSSEMKPAKSSAAANKSTIKHWGLIWRKKPEDTGIDFRLKNVLMRGNPDIDFTNPVCRLCNQEYNADLMYIRCEACLGWFHADAVELDESKIFNLVGFKCCKCRRIRSPICPYTDPGKKKVLKVTIKGPKPEVNVVDSNSPLASEYLMEVDPAYSALPKKAEVSHVSGDDPLLISPCADTSEVEYSNVSRSGPRKLTVRRHIKQEKDINSPHLHDPFQGSISAPPEVNVLNSSKKLPIRRHAKRENNSGCLPATDSFQVEVSNPTGPDSLSFQAQWDVSNGNFDDGIILDYDLGGDDDMDFEPQTYFSFHELLASDDGGSHANVNGPSENITGNWGNPTMLPENETLEISYDQEEPIISVGTTFEIVPCNICSLTEPCPDRSCQICGMWIHTHCSPWLESSYWEDGWRCGNCREWR